MPPGAVSHPRGRSVRFIVAVDVPVYRRGRRRWEVSHPHPVENRRPAGEYRIRYLPLLGALLRRGRSKPYRGHYRTFTDASTIPLSIPLVDAPPDTDYSLAFTSDPVREPIRYTLRESSRFPLPFTLAQTLYFGNVDSRVYRGRYTVVTSLVRILMHSNTVPDPPASRRVPLKVAGETLVATPARGTAERSLWLGSPSTDPVATTLVPRGGANLRLSYPLRRPASSPGPTPKGHTVKSTP